MIDWDKYKQADRVVVRYFNDDELVGKQVVNRPTQKTVADAVEQEKHWKHDRLPFLAWNSIASNFVYGSSAKCAPHEQYVCTRTQFEAYVKEQEGEKWTHTWKGDKCYVVYIDGCAAWVVLQNAGGKIIPTNSLTPIKPTLTKAQAWDKMAGCVNPRTMYELIMQKYDITD